MTFHSNKFWKVYIITSVFKSNRLYIRISRVAFEIFQGLFQILRYFRGNIRSKFSGFQKYQGLLARLLWEIFIKYARLSKISRVFRDIITLVFFRDVDDCLQKFKMRRCSFILKMFLSSLLSLLQSFFIEIVWLLHLTWGLPTKQLFPPA